MADLDLDAIRARADAASHAPWWPHYGGEQGYIYASEAKQHIATIHDELAGPYPNARFIAAARTDVPDLLAEVERLRERLTAAETVCAIYGRLGVQHQSKRDKACLQAWMDWHRRYGTTAEDVSDERVIELANRRDATRDSVIAKLRAGTEVANG